MKGEGEVFWFCAMVVGADGVPFAVVVEACAGGLRRADIVDVIAVALAVVAS